MGPHAIVLAVQLNEEFGLSFDKIATLFASDSGCR